jgi:uncharacterized membrane protein YagU involved in acid resistance
LIERRSASDERGVQGHASVDDTPQLTPDYAISGLVTHFALSIVFAVVFALVFVPLFSYARALLLGGIVYGGVL